MTVSNDIHLSPVRRHAAAMVWAPVALCRRLVPPHTCHSAITAEENLAGGEARRIPSPPRVVPLRLRPLNVDGAADPMLWRV